VFPVLIFDQLKALVAAVKEHVDGALPTSIAGRLFRWSREVKDIPPLDRRPNSLANREKNREF
jgi:hypothetical protein